MNDEHSHSSSQETDAIRLRAEESGDEALLFELYSSTREEELALTGWDEPTRKAFLNMQFRAMRDGYSSMFPRGQFSIILAKGTPVGRVVVDRSAHELHLADIVVLQAQRNRGIGGQVMKQLMAEASRDRKPVRLQVLKNSRATAFYRRLGFLRVGGDEIYEHMEWRPPEPGGPGCA
jgi:ribosomal protein S18 acetylase RimI-like enzyme